MMGEGETKEEIKEEAAGIFLSPEGILMMLIAIFIDIGEFFIPLEPVDPLDIFALIFLGSWMWFRSGRITATQKVGTQIIKVAKWAKRMKWLRPLCFILELIPLVGSLPLWTLVVYFELKHS